MLWSKKQLQLSSVEHTYFQGLFFSDLNIPVTAIFCCCEDKSMVGIVTLSHCIIWMTNIYIAFATFGSKFNGSLCSGTAWRKLLIFLRFLVCVRFKERYKLQGALFSIVYATCISQFEEVDAVLLSCSFHQLACCESRTSLCLVWSTVTRVRRMKQHFWNFE
jgi:hypothetical protein